jgi:hypothetical protein
MGLFCSLLVFDSLGARRKKWLEQETQNFFWVKVLKRLHLCHMEAFAVCRSLAAVFLPIWQVFCDLSPKRKVSYRGVNTEAVPYVVLYMGEHTCVIRCFNIPGLPARLFLFLEGITYTR